MPFGSQICCMKVLTYNIISFACNANRRLYALKCYYNSIAVKHNILLKEKKAQTNQVQMLNEIALVKTYAIFAWRFITLSGFQSS